MNHRIIGSTLPVLEFQLSPGESVVAVSGELSWMSQSITLQTSTQLGGGGGLFGAFRRVAGGGSLFMTQYSAQGAPGLLAFATRVPGHILPIAVTPASNYLVHRHGFLCGTPGVELNVGFQQSLGAGIFGGEGFLLQKISGAGEAWIELDGEVVQYDLGAGETLRVHPGHVGMFDATVSFSITRIPGIRNLLFGGDGIFLAALTGPGRVWLQSLPLANLAHALSPYLPKTVERVEEVSAAGAIGGLLRNLFSK
ncbi:MAG: TIGR00266 family protein [Verrucomicrobia bacterium]|nr:TIGR00266 family protein [Verrucomicrobiota bacterium]